MKRLIGALLTTTMLFSVIFSCGSIVVNADDLSAEGYLDNSSELITYSGQWESKTLTDAKLYGNDYMESSSDGTAEITPDVSANGYYKVYLRWPQASGFTDSLEISIKDGDNVGYSTVRNQTINGGYWVFIGTYFFREGKKQSVTISNNGGEKIALDGVKIDLSVKQDSRATEELYKAEAQIVPEKQNKTPEKKQAASFGQSLRNVYSGLMTFVSTRKPKKNDEEKSETATDKVKHVTASRSVIQDASSASGKNEFFMTNIGDEIIYDNTSKYFSTIGSGWQTVQFTDALNGSYVSDGDDAANLDMGAKWTPKTTVAGKYQLWLKWPAAEDRPFAAYVTVKNYYGVVAQVALDQTDGTDEWYYLGEYDMGAASISNQVIIRANDLGKTVADALKMKLVDYIDPSFGVYKQETGFEPNQTGYTSDRREEFNIVLDDDGKFMLTKNGIEFYVNGADVAYYDGLGEAMVKFAECGGNVVRNYSLDSAGKLLDYCYENGLYVAAGVVVSREASLYANAVAYREYIQQQKALIDKYKDHPALAMWCVNNEAEGRDVNGEVYAMIEELSSYIHKVDPYHPVFTAIAGANKKFISNMMSKSPSIDVIGINIYSPISTWEAAVRSEKWQGPTMITEFAPNGTWGTECERTSWGVVIERNNSEKADLYRESHDLYIKGPKNSIGGFAFCLPFAVGTEGTYSWYGFFFDGCSTPVMDEMCYEWTGSYPDNVAPRIGSYTINGSSSADNIIVEPGEELKLDMLASDRDGDAILYEFRVYEEVNTTFAGKEADLFYEAANEENLSSIKINAPSIPGYYRLFFIAKDGKGHICVDNIPFCVKRADKTAVDHSDDIIKALEAASKSMENGIYATVDVSAQDNNQGIPYTGTGSAVVEAERDKIHITADATYDVGGREKCDVYLTDGKAYISADGEAYTQSDSDEYYSMTDAYKKLLADKNVIKKMRYDDVSDNSYIVISGSVLLPELTPYALSGLQKGGFIDSGAGADNYSVKIYISKETGRIDKTIVTVGYMRSVENAQYRKLTFTYKYDYSKKTNIRIPQ